MNNNEFVAYFDEQLELAYKSKFSDSPSELRDAVKYALFGGGKRVRPTLCFLSGKFLGLSEERILPYALAIEFIHTYSLIHDDLPCMDNDDYRRGKPTVHKKFGESIALLAGDNLAADPAELVPAGKQRDQRVGAGNAGAFRHAHNLACRIKFALHAVERVVAVGKGERTFKNRHAKQALHRAHRIDARRFAHRRVKLRDLKVH